MFSPSAKAVYVPEPGLRIEQLNDPAGNKIVTSANS